MNQGKVRRTQKERRTLTVSKIIDAAIECLVERGYRGTTTQLISQRAGVSQGALFRHYTSRNALMIAVAQHVGDGLLKQFSEHFKSSAGIDDPVFLALMLLRKNCHERIHQAWFELQIAARTDDELLEALQPIWKHNREVTQKLAAQILPEMAVLSKDFSTIVDVMVSLFRGEALDSFMNTGDEGESSKIEMAQLMCELLVLHYKAKGLSTDMANTAGDKHDAANSG
ncbi:MAG: TetR/AcrR family transcriptional regulator [Oceanococcus sp.]